MRSHTAVVQRCQATGLYVYVGHVPSFPGAHRPRETLQPFKDNLRKAVALLLDDGEPKERKREHRGGR